MLVSFVNAAAADWRYRSSVSERIRVGVGVGVGLGEGAWVRYVGKLVNAPFWRANQYIEDSPISAFPRDPGRRAG